MMSFCALEALTESKDSGSENLIRVICLFDNEEVGSNTAHGADSNLLEVTLRRLAGVNFNGPIEVSFAGWQSLEL
jgi:aspartyl aminopeptidase